MTLSLSSARPWIAAHWRYLIWGAVAVLLLIPAIAMRFTKEVAWTASDFLFAILLLGGGGLAIEATVRLIKRPAFRMLIGAAVLAVVALIWVDGAVGVF